MYSFDDITARITIVDVLRDHGIKANGRRIPCPIHQGDNPMSFSYNDAAFHCFSCGAKGGLIDLVLLLRGCNRDDAIHYLAERTGISLTVGRGSERKSLPKRRMTAEIVQRRQLKFKLHYLSLIRDCLTRELRARQNLVKSGAIRLAEHYAEEQKLEYRLEYLDADMIRLTHLLHSLTKGVN